MNGRRKYEYYGTTDEGIIEQHRAVHGESFHRHSCSSTDRFIESD